MYELFFLFIFPLRNLYEDDIILVNSQEIGNMDLEKGQAREWNIFIGCPV